MIEPHPLRGAAEAGDHELLAEMLCEDVVLHSPIVFRGFEGRVRVSALRVHVLATREDFTYTNEVSDGNTVVLHFKARVGDRELEGIDLLEHDEEGKIAEITVFMRPLSAINAFNQRMNERLGV
jgi:hypothetical protein